MNIFVRIFNAITTKFLGPIRDAVKRLNKRLDPYFDTAWSFRSLFSKVATIFFGFVTIFTTFISLFWAIMNVGSLVDIVKGTFQGQDYWLQKLEHVIAGYPSFQSLITAMDSQFSALSQYFTPPLTFTRILQVTGIGDAVNTIIVCAVQGIAFVISMRLLFWSLGRVKLTMVKPIK